MSLILVKLLTLLILFTKYASSQEKECNFEVPEAFVIPISVKEDIVVGTIFQSSNDNIIRVTNYEDGMSLTAINSPLESHGDGVAYIEPVFDERETGRVAFKVIKSIDDVPDGEDGVYLLSFAIGCNGKRLQNLISFKIDQINDNAPIFDKPSFEFTVQDVLPPRYVININEPFKVTDEDSIESGHASVNVLITSGNTNNEFELDTQSRSSKVGRYDVYLVAVKRLIVREYNLNLRASDGVHANDLSVKVIVKASQTKDPIFEHPTYGINLHFEENGDILVKDDESAVLSKPEGFTINHVRPATIKAYDQDEDIDAELDFIIVSNGEGIDYSDYFELIKSDAQPGERKLKIKKMDQKIYNQPSISFLIKTWEVEDVERTAFAMVSIAIEKKRTDPPLFIQNVELLRYTSLNAEVYKLELADSNKMKYKLSGKDKDTFNLVGTSILLASQIPDDVTEMEIEIEASVQSDLSPLINNIKINFDVVEIKRNQEPYFEKSVYNGDVWLDARPKDEVITITPIKAGTLMRVLDGDIDSFNFDESSGLVSVGTTLTKNQYNLRIKGILPTDPDIYDLTEIRVFTLTKSEELFEKSVHQIQIPSDFKPQEPIFTLPHKKGTTMKIESQSPNSPFLKFNSGTGSLIFTESVADKEEEYWMVITGEYLAQNEADNGNGPKTWKDRTEVRIKVTKVSESLTHLFSKRLYATDVYSDTAARSQILKIEIAKDVVASLEVSPDEADLFELAGNGEIILKKKFTGDNAKEYKLKVVGEIASEKRKDETMLHITVVTAKNPVDSLFAKDSYAADAYSDTKANSKLLTIKMAEDVVATLSEPSSMFELSGNGDILLKQGFSEGGPASFNFKVTGTKDERVDETQVVITTVQVKKPVEPLFEKERYVIDVYSDAELGTTVLELKMTTGVTAMFSGPTEFFKLNKDSGVITLEKKLTLDTYTLSVLGELKTESRTGQTEIIVHLVKKKSPDPIFDKSVFLIDVASDSAPGEILKLIAKDETEMTLEKIVPEDPIFAIDKLGGSLKLIGALNPATEEYKITVKGELKTGQTEAVDVVLRVLKRKVPLFEKTVYLAQTNSDIKPRDHVFTLTPTLPGTTMKMKSQSPTEGILEFDPGTGKIWFARSIISETPDQYVVTITGEKKSEALEDETEIRIAIVKIKEAEKALFDQRKYVIDVYSDTVPGTVVLALKMTEGTKASLDTADIFEINTDSGELTLKKPLSGTNSAKHALKVTGTKGDRMDQSEVVIHVTNRKDPPEAIFKKDVYTLDIISDAHPGNLFTIIPNIAETEITIKGISPNHAIFKIGKTDGVLELTGKFEKDIKEYRIDIRGELTSENRYELVQVIVNVVDTLRPYQPIFLKSVYHVDLPSQTPDKGVVATIDYDTSLGDVNFQLEGEDSKVFSANPKTATISLVKSIENSPETIYEIVVVGKTGGASILEDRIKVVFHVVDVARPMTPLFTKSKYIVEVDECTALDKVIFTLPTENSEPLEISITGGKDKDYFSVDPTTGTIKLAKIISQGVTYNVRFEAKVKDKADQIDRTDVVLNVRESESCGLLNGTSLYVEIAAGKSIGDVVHEAIEPKEPCEFTATGGDTDVFRVDPSTGQISLLKTPSLVYYNLDISLQSKPNPEKVANLKVVFKSEIEYPLIPVFKRSLQEVDISIDSLPGQYSFRVETKDEADWKLNFELNDKGHTLPFKIDPANGVLSLESTIKKDESYPVEVKATLLAPKPARDITTITFHGVEVKRPIEGIFSRATHIVSLAVCEKLGSTLYTVDKTTDGALLKIVDGDMEYFELEAGSGNITLKQLLLNERTYNLKLSAVLDNPIKQDFAWVEFHVTDSGKCALFDKSAYVIDLSPDVQVGQVVHTLKSKIPVSADITGGESESFFELKTIDQTTFDIVVKSEINASIDRFELEITATSETHNNSVETVKIILQIFSRVPVHNFPQSVYKIDLEDGLKVGDILVLNNLTSEEADDTYSIVGGSEFFVLSPKGELSLKVDSETLLEKQYFLVIEAIPAKKGLYTALEIPDVKSDQALIVISRILPPKFLENSPYIKVLLPSAKLNEYMVDIKTEDSKAGLEFSIKDQTPSNFFAVAKSEGALHPIQDVTKVEPRTFNVDLEAKDPSNRSAFLRVMFVRLIHEETIVFEIEKVIEVAELIRTIANGTGYHIKLLQVNQAQNTPVFYSYGKADPPKPGGTSVILAALDWNYVPVTTEAFKGKLSELVEDLGTPSVVSYPNQDPLVDKPREPEEQNGLVAAVAVLGALLGIIFIAIIILVVLKMKRPSILSKLLDVPDAKPFKRPPTPPRKSNRTSDSEKGSYSSAMWSSSHKAEDTLESSFVYGRLTQENEGTENPGFSSDHREPSPSPPVKMKSFAPPASSAAAPTYPEDTATTFPIENEDGGLYTSIKSPSKSGDGDHGNDMLEDVTTPQADYPLEADSARTEAEDEIGKFKVKDTIVLEPTPAADYPTTIEDSTPPADYPATVDDPTPPADYPATVDDPTPAADYPLELEDNPDLARAVSPFIKQAEDPSAETTPHFKKKLSTITDLKEDLSIESDEEAAESPTTGLDVRRKSKTVVKFVEKPEIIL